jgi:hypothetical protein
LQGGIDGRCREWMLTVPRISNTNIAFSQLELFAPDGWGCLQSALDIYVAGCPTHIPIKPCFPHSSSAKLGGHRRWTGCSSCAICELTYQAWDLVQCITRS